MRKKMFLILSIILVAGILTAFLGVALGAKFYAYIDKTGVHIDDEIVEIPWQEIEEITDIDIMVSSSNIEFCKSEKFGIEMRTYRQTTYDVSDGKLVISDHGDSFKFNIGFNFFNINEIYIKVYLPENEELNSVKINTDYGNININNLSADLVDLSDSFGSIKISDISAGKINANLSNGSFRCRNVEADVFIYKNDFGSGTFDDVKFNDCSLEASNGKLEVNTSRIFTLKAENDFGKITLRGLVSDNVKINASNGAIDLQGDFKNIDICSDFGSIQIDTVRPADYYSCKFETDFGSIKVDGENFGNRYMSNYTQNIIHASASNGSINMNFNK